MTATPPTDVPYIVTVDTGPNSTPADYKIMAVSIGADERYLPGWTTLKNAAGKIAAAVRSDRALLIRRMEPTEAAQAAAPSPASLAQLAGRGGKPGQV